MTIDVTRRTFLIAAAGAVAVAGLTACSPGQNNGTSTSPHTGPSDATEDQSITVWDYDPTGIDAWVTADADFGSYFAEKYPAISVKRNQAPFVGFAEALLTSIAGGAKYDVIYGWSNWLPQFRQNKVVQTLDSFLAAESDISADSFFDYGKDVSMGGLYGLAWYASAQFMYFNKTAFEQAGVADPASLDANGRWDYEALRSVAEKMTTGKGTDIVFGSDFGTTRGTGDFSSLSRGFGSDIWNKDLSKSTMDSSQNDELYAYIQDIYASRWTPTPTEGNGLSDVIGFGNERIMTMTSGTNYFRQAAQTGVPERFDIGLSRIPKGPGGQQHVCFINSYYMGAKGANTNGGWIWYKERSFSDRANELYVETGAGRFPVKKDQQPVTVYPFEDPALFEQIRTDMYATRVIDKQAKFDEAFGTAWDRIALEGGDVAPILTELTTTANGLVS